MEVDRFQVLESYVKSIDQLAKWDINLAYELSYRIIQYWIYGEEPPADSNPFMLAVFNQIKIPIDTWKNISKVNSKNWKRGWRPLKDWKSSQKANGKRNESETISEKKQNIKIKNKKIKKENIKEKKTLFWDFIELTPTEYSKLKDIFWEVRLRKIINEVDNSIGMHGYSYESHYRVILKRYAEEIEELKKKGEKKKSQLPDYDTLDPILMP